MSTQIHPTAHVSEDARIGEGTQIGANSYVGGDVGIGVNCQIGQNVSIGANVSLGEAVIVEDGVTVVGPAWIDDGTHLYQGVRVGDELQCGKAREGLTYILHGSQVMDGARIAHGVKIGPKAMIRPSAHVVEDVKTGWVVSGDPAKLIFILDVEGATI